MDTLIAPETTRVHVPVFGLLATAIILGGLAAAAPLAALVISLGVLSILLALLLAIRPYWVVLLLAAFMPFESFILKFLPGPDQLYLASQFGSELLIYLTLVGLVLHRILRGGTFRRTPLDVPILILAGIAVLSIFINQAPVVGSLMNLRPLARYIALFYLVVNLDLTSVQVTRLIRVILFIGLVQLLVGGLQLVSGSALDELLKPRQTDLEVMGQTRSFVLIKRGREFGSIFGTLGDTLYFGLFMLVILAVYLGLLRTLNGRSLLLIGAIFMMVMYSYARAAVFGILLMLVVFYGLRHGLKKTVLFFLLMAPAALVGVFLIAGSFSEAGFVNPLETSQSIIQNVTGVFSRDYVERAQKHRLGALTETAPTVLVNRPIWGYGPDPNTTIERLNESQHSFLAKALSEKGFEDVYWVATLAYFGLFGVGALLFLIYRLFASAWKIYNTAVGSLTKQIALSAICITALTPFLLLFYRVLKFRIFGFYFWLIAALMFMNYLRERSSDEGLTLQV